MRKASYIYYITISSAQGAPSAQEKQYHNMLENIAGNTSTLIGLFGTALEGTMGIVMELQISVVGKVTSKNGDRMGTINPVAKCN